MPWATPDYGVEDAANWIAGNPGDLYRFAMFVDEGTEVIGTCGLNHYDPLNLIANLGYWARSDHTSRSRLLLEGEEHDAHLFSFVRGDTP